MRLSFSSGRSHFDKTMQVNKQLRLLKEKLKPMAKLDFLKVLVNSPD
ncbi:MAG: hypothetical protein SOI14_03775 [Lactococcus cremoris]|jgi:hypothetical protein